MTSFSVPDFQKHVFRLIARSYLHSGFSQAHLARKLTWFWMFCLQALTGHFYKNFEIFRKFRDNTQVARVCIRGIGLSPKLTSRLQVHVKLRK